MTVKILKLVTGAEIIGDVITDAAKDVASDTIVVADPLQINYRYYSGAIPAVTITRYALFSDRQPIKIHWSHVVNIINPREIFCTYYNKHKEFYFTELEQPIDDDLKSAVDPTSQTSPVTEKQLQLLLEGFSFDNKVPH